MYLMSCHFIEPQQLYFTHFDRLWGTDNEIFMQPHGPPEACAPALHWCVSLGWHWRYYPWVPHQKSASQHPTILYSINELELGSNLLVSRAGSARTIRVALLTARMGYDACRANGMINEYRPSRWQTFEEIKRHVRTTTREAGEAGR